MPQKQRKRSVYFYKTGGQPQCNEGADLALQNSVKKFAADKDE